MSALLRRHVLTLLLLVVGLSWIVEQSDQIATPQGQESLSTCLQAGIPRIPPTKKSFPRVIPVSLDSTDDSSATNTENTLSWRGFVLNIVVLIILGTFIYFTLLENVSQRGRTVYLLIGSMVIGLAAYIAYPAVGGSTHIEPVSGAVTFSWFGFIWRIGLFLFLTYLITGFVIDRFSYNAGGVVGLTAFAASCVFAYLGALPESAPSPSSDSIVKVTPPPAPSRHVGPVLTRGIRINPIIEKEIREQLQKPTGEITEADLGRQFDLFISPLEIPLTKEESAKVIEAAIRKRIKKPTGEFTKADLEKVRELELQRNRLTDVKGLEKCTQLIHLVLYGNKLTDVKGLEKLAKLTHLNLWNNQLTDVKGLEKLTHLYTLKLENNPALTKDQIDELQKALPKCQIFSNAK